jgi:hypothetical protein
MIFDGIAELVDNEDLMPFSISRHDSGMPKNRLQNQFNDLIDLTVSSFQHYFEKEDSDLRKCEIMEKILLGQAYDRLPTLDVLYPKMFDVKKLELRLRTFHLDSNMDSLQKVIEKLQAISNCARDLFGEVLQLAMLIVALPISTCESERTFSALKRLKTYLRSTMSQERLNG